ncbi:MAG: cytochrome c biogenesis protein CcsA [Acidimicrobiales bacterium]
MDLAVLDRPLTRTRLADAPYAVLLAITAAVWLGLARLALAFWRSSLDWEYVAEQSRTGAPWYYRLAGVWGGMEGSLLLFIGVLGVVTLIAGRRVEPLVRWTSVATLGTLAGANLLIASPFRRLDVPATEGFGMNPVLEHPAMAIHPPLLYAGLAASGGAALVAAGSSSAHPFRIARPWLLVTLSLLTAAMTLGAAWSYMEQGWGGYWAWDPVENTSLLVWLAALVAIHAAPRVRQPWALAWCLAPWLLALLGAALVRSGRTPSVHGFAEQLGIGWTIFVLAIATAAAAALAVRRARFVSGNLSESGRWADTNSPVADPRRVTVLLVSLAAVIVLAGTVAPVLADLFGGRSTAVRGEFYGRAVGPLAIAAVPFLAMRLRGVGVGRRRPVGWSTVAHAGTLVLLAGIGVSTFDDAATVPLAAGTTVRAAGVDVRNDGVSVGDGSRRGTEAVTAAVDVDGHEMRPQLVVYPDRGGRLAEVAVRTGPFTDVHVVLETAIDDGTVVVTVQRRHGMWLVWLGALVMTVATLGAARRRGRSQIIG